MPQVKGWHWGNTGYCRRVAALLALEACCGWLRKLAEQLQVRHSSGVAAATSVGAVSGLPGSRGRSSWKQLPVLGVLASSKPPVLQEMVQNPNPTR